MQEEDYKLIKDNNANIYKFNIINFITILNDWCY